LAFAAPPNFHPGENLSTDDSELGAFIGVFMLDPGYEAGSVEIGYVLARPFWRQGFGLEGARALMEKTVPTINLPRRDFGFELGFSPDIHSAPRITSVFATSSPENSASIKILDKLGFKPFPLALRDKIENGNCPGITLKGEFRDHRGAIRTLGIRNGVEKYFFLRVV
jgi:RimJ/RimL family protein N-acetyltransferase